VRWQGADPVAAITQLLALTPSAGPWRKKLADASIKYSAHAGECPSGDPALQHYIGELYYKGRFSSSLSGIRRPS
jgi:hypothetical protein